MAKFSYRAYGADGGAVDGQVEAHNRSEALESLQSRGLRVDSLKAAEGASYAWRQNRALTWEDINLFSMQLATMARSHLPLSAGVRNLAADMHRPRLKQALDQLHKDLENGHSLSGALEAQGNTFPPIFVSMLRCGEASGNLPAVLHLCSQHSRRMADLKQGIIGAMVYPAFLFIFALVILGAMMVFVIPEFADIFMEFGGELPPSTRLIIKISSLPPLFWAALPLLGFTMIVALHLLSRTHISAERFSNLQESFVEALPLLKTIHNKLTLARFFQTLATLFNAHVPIVESVELAGQASGSFKLKIISMQIASKLEQGTSLSQAMAESDYFTNHMCWLVSMGEEHGEVAGSFESLAESLDRESRHLDGMITSMITPIMVMFISLLFGFIVVALYSPIFKLGDSISGG